MDKPTRQVAVGERTKNVQRRERATGSDFEDVAMGVGPARNARAVEVPVGSQRQPRLEGATTGVQRRERTARGDFEDHPVKPAAIPICRPVKIVVRAFDQSPAGTAAPTEQVDCVEGLGR